MRFSSCEVADTAADPCLIHRQWTVSQRASACNSARLRRYLPAGQTRPSAVNQPLKRPLTSPSSPAPHRRPGSG
ncbi:MAG: hypothetical protein K9M02_08425 [Thiohalocapsa sp.]|nr:hypothetical protein [Thiohalocapsa sp.]